MYFRYVTNCATLCSTLCGSAGVSAQLAWCDPVRGGGWGGEGGGVGVRIVYKMYVEGAITVRVWEWCMCEGVRSVCEGGGDGDDVIKTRIT